MEQNRIRLILNLVAAENMNWNTIHQRCQVSYFENPAAPRIISIDWDTVENCVLVENNGYCYRARALMGANENFDITFRDILRAFNVERFEVVDHWALQPADENLLDTIVCGAPLCQFSLRPVPIVA